MARRCFVISPIGPEASEIREHADAVYDYIIKPAMEECGIEAIRSDHLHEPGRISDQMFREILTDDLCIAVLAYKNPNVFYELAIAQAVGRPVILLLQKEDDLPFDVKDLRCVSYDLKPKPLFEKTYVNEIIQHVQSLEKTGWKAGSLFGSAVSMIAHGGQPAYFSESDDYGKSDNWLRLLKDTEKAFELMGITLSWWRRAKGFARVLQEKASAGCKVRILLMHRENPSLRGLINDKIPEVNFEMVRRDADDMFGFFLRIAAEHQDIEVRRLLHGCIHSQLTRSDQYGIFIPYFYSERTQHTPLWQCDRDSLLYNLLIREFEALWRANEPEAK